MKDYFRPGSGLSLEPARWGLGSGVRGARGPRVATCSARGRRDALGPVGGLRWGGILAGGSRERFLAPEPWWPNSEIGRAHV